MRGGGQISTDRFQGVVDRLRVSKRAPDRARIVNGVVGIVPARVETSGGADSIRRHATIRT